MRCLQKTWWVTVCFQHRLKSIHILSRKSLQGQIQFHKFKSTKKNFSKNVINNIKKLNKENKMLYGPKRKTFMQKKSYRDENPDNVYADSISYSGYVSLDKSFKHDDHMGVDVLCQETDEFFNSSHPDNLEITRHLNTLSFCDFEEVPAPPLINAEHIFKDFGETSENAEALCDKKTDISSYRDGLKALDVILDCPMCFDDAFSKSSSLESYRILLDKLNLKSLPGVNHILNETLSESSKFLLKRWKEKMIIELGEDGFRKYQQDTFRTGINLHTAVQKYLDGMPTEDLELDPSNRGHWASLETVLPHVTNIIKQETSVTHSLLCYKGIFDCIAEYRDTLYLIEWKTSAKRKPSIAKTYDNPLQLAAYIGAVNYSRNSYLTCDIRNALLVVAYQDGQDCDVHFMDEELCKKYWKQWCQRLHEYWKNCLGTYC